MGKFDLTEEEQTLVYEIESTKPITSELIKKAYETGVIPKDKLKHKTIYLGSCRNASVAVWNKNKEEFIYIRNKFGMSYLEEINPIEKDDGFDLFIPFREIDIDEGWKKELLDKIDL